MSIQDKFYKFMDFVKKISLKDFLNFFFLFISLLISFISIRQSSTALSIQQKTLAISIQVSAHEQEDASVKFIPFPAGDMDPFPGTYGFIELPLEVRIDNISLRKVSITELDATPILEDPDNKEMTPFITNGILITTNFSKPLRKIANGKISDISLPIALDQGDSIILVGNVGWPLDYSTSSLLTKNLQPIDKLISLYDLKTLLAENNKTLSRASIELAKDEKGTSIPFPVSIGRSKLIYRIDVFTSFNTHEKTYLDLNADLVHSSANWDLLIPNDENEINSLLGK